LILSTRCSQLESNNGKAFDHSAFKAKMIILDRSMLDGEQNRNGESINDQPEIYRDFEIYRHRSSALDLAKDKVAQTGSAVDSSRHASCTFHRSLLSPGLT